VFSAGLGLRIRMYVALALNAVLLVVLLAIAAWLFTTEAWPLLFFAVCFAVIGIFGLPDWRDRYRKREAVDVERARRAVERLCPLADIPVPEVQGEYDGPPLTWTTAVPGRRRRIHVTRALLATLDDAQVEAVLAHELSHIANRDAVVMTVLAAPGVSVLRGMQVMWDDRDSIIRSKMAAVMYGMFFVVPAAISALFARIVSRHRELAADRGAAMLTGSPVAVSSALLRVSAEIAAIPNRDLRIAGTNDLLNLVPVRPEVGIARLWATHPRLTTRVRQLEELEERLQAG
jgi:heat shock protein HtpX